MPASSLAPSGDEGLRHRLRRFFIEDVAYEWTDAGANSPLADDAGTGSIHCGRGMFFAAGGTL